MKIINIKSKNLTSYDTACFFSSKSNLENLVKEYSFLKPYIDSNIFKGEKNEISSFPLFLEGNKIDIFLVGISENPTKENILDTFGSLAKKISSKKLKEVFVDCSSLKDVLNNKIYYTTFIKGLYYGSYSFNKFFTEKKSEEPNSISIYSEIDNADNFLTDSLHIVESATLSKTLVDEPSNILKPESLSRIVSDEFSNTNIDVDIYDRKKIEALGMNLFLSVGKGSDAEPKLIVMKYMGDPTSSDIVGLVGKGITYDSGGYSIKPTDSMITMKSDMGGAAAVIGAMKLISHQKPKRNIVAVVAACENMISGKAYLPGDILKSMNGKTVEIVNTDAEGRLTLADAMTYIIRVEKATKVVDICTLTGACVVALGEEFAGVITKEDSLWDKLSNVSTETLEPCWRLPINENIINKNKSKVADLKNSGGRWAGCESAGAFVGEFTEDLPWIHIDIAGTAYIEDEKPAYRVGGTGFGAHLLADLAEVL